ncbi:MAG: hypothetical protein R3F54_29255 [Alphaproteobacteria bacterium]
MLDRFESLDRGFLKVRAGSGNAPEKDDTVFICNRWHSIDDVGRRRLLKEMGQWRERLVPTQSAKGAGSRIADLRQVILKASRETGHHLRIPCNATARSRTHMPIFVLEELQDRVTREYNLEAACRGHRRSQGWSLDGAFENDLRH